MSSPAKAFEPETPKNGPAKDPGVLVPWLPCTLTLDLPITEFTVGDLMKLAVGSVVSTRCKQASDIPLRVNGQLIGWTEFEVVGQRIAVRITDLA